MPVCHAFAILSPASDFHDIEIGSKLGKVGMGKSQYPSLSSLESSWQECSEDEDGYSSEEAENEEDEDDTEEAEEDDDEEMMVPGMEGKEEVCGKGGRTLERTKNKYKPPEFDVSQYILSVFQSLIHDQED